MISEQLREFQYLDDGRFKVIPEYPEFAWFEGLVNAVTHRNHAFGGDHIRVMMYDDRVEILSPGKLPSIVTLENSATSRVLRRFDTLEASVGQDVIEGLNGYEIAAVQLALLLNDGTLEINYYERRTSITGGRIVQVFEIDPAGYSSASARSYDSIKPLVKKVHVDSTIAGLGITNCNYWFSAFSNCTKVCGFENLSGMTIANQMFTSCSSLETIYAASFINSGLSGSLLFYSCGSLVGGNGTAWASSKTAYTYFRIDTASTPGHVTAA